MLCHFCKTGKTSKQLAYSSLISPDGWVPIYSPENEMQTQCLYMSFWQDIMSDLVCVFLSLLPQGCFATGGLPLCNTDVSPSSACFIFQVTSKSICFCVSLVLPSPNTFWCYINNLHLPLRSGHMRLSQMLISFSASLLLVNMLFR